MTPRPSILVFSPHLDDAVLSVGQVLASMPGAVVATCLAGLPSNPEMLAEFDKRSGFDSARGALAERRAEDVAACAFVGARTYHMPFVDSQYESVIDVPALAQLIDATIRQTRATMIAGPLGIEHPDHLAVAKAFAAVLGAPPRHVVEAYVYEDLPGRVLWPDQTYDRRVELARTLDRTLVLASPASPGPVTTKVLAVRAYRSQMWALDPVWHPTMCPERMWRVMP